jgi:hypothetical protein
VTIVLVAQNSFFSKRTSDTTTFPFGSRQSQSQSSSLNIIANSTLTRRTLASVHPERFARPDFSKWLPHKDVAGSLVNDRKVGGAVGAPSQLHGQAHAGPMMSLPENVARFLNVLPAAIGYDGELGDMNCTVPRFDF